MSENSELAAKKHLSRILCYGHSTWKTFTEEHTTSYTQRRTSLAVSNTRYLLQWHTLPTNSRTIILTGDTWKNLFSFWLVYFCYYNKPFVVVFQKKFHYLFVLSINLSSSSSSCRAGSTDIPDPLSPLFPFVHRLWLVFWVTSRILT